MTDELNRMELKALAFVQGMAALPKKELALEITKEYADDYNRLRQIVAGELPNDEQYLPPVVKTDRDDPSGARCWTRYVELLTYVRTIRDLVVRSIRENREKQLPPHRRGGRL